MGNPFWDYSLAAYALDGVAPTCLALQDRFDLDVNLLLYAAWLASMQQCLSADHIAGVDAAIVDWRHQVVKPLRALRRQWHGFPLATALRDEIKILELRAEQQQQEMIFDFFKSTAVLPRGPQPLRQNLVLVAQFASHGNAGWEPSVESLVTLLPL